MTYLVDYKAGSIARACDGVVVWGPGLRLPELTMCAMALTLRHTVKSVAPYAKGGQRHA